MTKESNKRFGEILKKLESIQEKLKNMDERLDSIEEDIEPIKGAYRDASGFARVIKWIIGILLTMGAVLATIKGIWK